MSLPFRRAAAGALAACALFAGAYCGLNAAVQRSPMLPADNPDSYIPKLHWVMMGLHGNGNYYDPDYQLTLSVPAAERDALVQAEITSRLEEYGVGGLLAHFWEKTSYVWGDGSYSSCFKIDRDRVRVSSLDRYIKSDGEAFEPYSRYAQGLMAFMILGMAVCGLLVYKNGRLGRALLAPCACVVGLFLFFLVWEARSRYIFNYAPLFAVMAVCAWSRIYAAAARTPFFGAKAKKLKNRKDDV